MNMIEKVGKALYVQSGMTYARKEYWDDMAKAAILVMRDLVKCNPNGNKADNDIVEYYIDAALKEE